MLSLVGEGTAVTIVSDGAVVSIVKVLTDKFSLVLLSLSVTLIVQLSYVPSARVLKVIGLLLTLAEVVELLQPPAYDMVPASFELNV